MKAFKFKLYYHKRNRHLKRQIHLAAEIYNHCIALHKRYYRRYGKSLNAYPLKKHITQLKKREKYAHWNQLGSQAIQDVVERIDRAYKLFFRNLKAGIKTAPPSFKKRIKYKSFTLKQAGYQLLQDNYIRIGKRIYRYFKSRDIEGHPKTLTVKRDALGDLYIIIVTDAEGFGGRENVPRTGQSVGFDFGLKTFLTASDGNDVASPLFFKQSENIIRRANKELSSKKRGSHHRSRARLNLARKHRKIANQRNDFHWKLADLITDDYDFIFFEDLNLKGMQSENIIRRANKELSSKKRGSHHRERARLNLARKHRKIANQRNDFHWKLADLITDDYDFIFFEDLNLKGMQSLWGKKITDLGFYSFLQKVKYYAGIKEKHVSFIDRFYPSSKTCSDCGSQNQKLELRQREWDCPTCGVIHDRDRNASVNIAREGASSLGRGDVRSRSIGTIAA